jgi:hypothetical protein
MGKIHNIPLPIGKINWIFVYANFTLKYIQKMYMHNTRENIVVLPINFSVSYYMCLRNANKVDHMRQVVVVWLVFV